MCCCNPKFKCFTDRYNNHSYPFIKHIKSEDNYNNKLTYLCKVDNSNARDKILSILMNEINRIKDDASVRKKKKKPEKKWIGPIVILFLRGFLIYVQL